MYLYYLLQLLNKDHDMAYNRAVSHFGFISFLWIYLLCPLVSGAIFLEVGPQNQTVVEGDRVTLICDVNNGNDNTIFWTYLIGPGRRLFISSNDYIYPFESFGVDPNNYKIVIDESQQIYTLVIKSINLSTEAGIYDCGYEYGSGRRYAPLASAMITVTSLPDSVSCHLNLLSSLESEEKREFEVGCSWTHSQPGHAYFDSSSGETIDVDLRFPDRIISRIENRDNLTIICRFKLESNASITINAPCIGDDTSGLVRVDPFIGEVTVGSSASFVCTSGNQNYSSEISWDVSVNGSAPFVSQERLIKSNEVMTIVKVQDDDEYLLIECKVYISEDVMVASYASLRIVEVTTPPSRRPHGVSRSNRTTKRTKTKNSIVAITKPVPVITRGGINYETLAAVVPLLVIIITALVITIIILVIIIVILVRRQNRGSLERCNEERSNELPLEISSDSHTYSNRIFLSDISLFSS